MIWRFGQTRIERPGPFSDLSGFDRLLAVVEGRGLVLRPAGVPALDVRARVSAGPLPGEWQIESELEDGPVAVVNLMADRHLAAIDLRFATGWPSSRSSRARSCSTPRRAPRSWRRAGGSFELAPADALQIERDATDCDHIALGRDRRRLDRIGRVPEPLE